MPTPSKLFLSQGGGGRFLEQADIPALALARSHKYGDGLFETAICSPSGILMDHFHYSRLWKGMRVLGLEEPHLNFRTNLKRKVNMLCASLGTPYGRLRIELWRSGGGTYLPENDHADWMLEIYPLDSHPWENLQETPLRLCIFDKVPLVHSPLSAVKSCSALPYILAARHAKAKGFDDALLLSTDGGIAEASSSNLFIRHGKLLITPHLQSGCLPGTLRERVLLHASSLGLQAIEQRIAPHDLDHADEAFLTNAIQGIRPIAKVAGTRFKRHSSELVTKMSEMLRP